MGLGSILSKVIPIFRKGGSSILSNPSLRDTAIQVGTGVLGSRVVGSGGVADRGELGRESLESIRQGRKIATDLEPAAANLLSMGARSFEPVQDYYRSILSGDRSKAMSALSPEIQQINEGYDANLRAAGDLMPRGGGRSALLAEAPYQRTRDISNILSTARPQAAQGLLRVGSESADVGRSLYSAVLAALNGASDNSSRLLGTDLASRQDSYNRGRDLGRTLYDILSKVKLGGGGKKSGSSGGGNDIIWSTGE